MVYFKSDNDGVQLMFPATRDGIVTAIAAVEAVIEHLKEYERATAELERFARFLRKLPLTDIQ